MSTRPRLAPAAAMRLRTFNIVVATIVGVFAAGYALIAYSVLDGDGLRTPPTNSDYYYPWQNPEPVDAVREGDTWSGRGQAVMRLSGLDPAMPLQVAQGEDESRIYDLRLRVPGDPEQSDSDSVSIDTYDDVNYLIPGHENIELWVRTRDTDPWSFTITPYEGTAREGVVSGVSDEAFLYGGSATAARVVTRGGSVRIEVVTASGNDTLFSSSNAPEGTIAWPDTPSALFIVDAYDASWSISFFETVEGEG